MKTWSYEARSQSGKNVKGSLEAGTKDEVVSALQNQGLMVVHISEELGLSMQKLMNFQVGGIPLNDKVIFMKQFATMVTAGLPITEALESLTTQIKNPNFRDSMESVLKEVKSGNSLSGSFKKYPVVFDEVQINLISAGEESGNLVEMIIKISKDMDSKRNFVAKVRGAMIYPILILVAIIVIIVILMVTMVPAVATLFESFNAPVPAITQFMIDASNFLNPAKSIGGIAIIVFVIAGVIAFNRYNATKAGRRVVDTLILKVPIFGEITSKLNTEEFCRVMSMLMQGGVPIIDAIKITAGAMSNVLYKEAVMDIIPQVEKGLPMAAPLIKSNVFPSILTRMVATGEQTGKIDKVLNDMGKYYAEDLENITSNLTKLMEPVILLIVGVLVGFLAIAIYLPIYQLATVVK